MNAIPNPKRVLLYEVVAFTFLLIAIWTGSLLPMLLRGRTTMEWEDPILETIVLVLVAVPTLILSKRILDRLHYLEGFLRLCAWCHRVNVNGEWILIEEFLKRRLSTQTSHGICESCNQIIRNEIQARRQSREDHA
jgi:hypothetical protein